MPLSYLIDDLEQVHESASIATTALKQCKSVSYLHSLFYIRGVAKK